MVAYRRSVGASSAMALAFLVWLTCFALSVDDAVRETAYEPVLVTRGASDGYPRFLAQKAGLEQPHLPITRGDAIVAVGGLDLKDASAATWIAAFARFAGPAAQVATTYEHDGRRAQTTLTAGSYRAFWPRHLASLAYVVCALFLAFRARPTRLVDAIVWTNLVSAIFFACTFAGGVTESALGIVAHVVSLALAAPLALRAVLLFPHGEPPRSALARYGPWAFSVLALFDASRFYGTPLSHEAGALGSAVVGLVYVALSIGISARTYLRSAAPARRQMRWMVLAGYLISVPFVLAIALTAFDARFGSVLALAIASFGVLPIAVAIALVRSNLFDVDRLLGSAGSYTVVIVIVLAGALWAVPALADTVHQTTGVESSIVQVVVAFALALCLVRLHGWLRPRIDRLFFAELYAFERGMHALLDELSGCAGPLELCRIAGERVARALRLDGATVFLAAGDVLAPVFVRGRSPVAPLTRQSPLVATLQDGPRVIADDSAALDPFERAVLEKLEVPLVLPIRDSGGIVGALALGHKRSGDVFTTTECALLVTVADKIASELKRFDQDERLAASDRLQAALRQYVEPGIAERLARGEDVDLGEREVSVLFSDLRGYTTYAEDRPLDEVHATVNRYAEVVAEIVHQYGGTVTDFAGDGMMAVFGAPGELDGKERAAVAAALRIVETVRELELAPGVGIATGPAWVATVRAGGQLHWSALGDTTNLASRIQSLTRELDAWVAIDETTWRRAGDEARDFVARGPHQVRGRSTAEEIYVLPVR